MATDRQTRDERIDCRVNLESKQLFARAAQISGSSISAFIVESARARAIRILAEHERLVLNNEARDQFMQALDNPPSPNATLRAAAKKYTAK